MQLQATADLTLNFGGHHTDKSKPSCVVSSSLPFSSQFFIDITSVE